MILPQPTKTWNKALDPESTDFWRSVLVVMAI